MAILSTRCSLLLHEGKEGVCARCGRTLRGRQKKWCGHGCEDIWWEQHYWPLARKLALKRDQWKCVRCDSTDNLTVDHIIPLMGRGYKSGCVHHLTNLQTLCHECHVGKTNDDLTYQRSLRKAGVLPGRNQKRRQPRSA